MGVDMKIDLTHPLFQAALPVMEVLEKAGYAVYFVGGCVRDVLLGRPIHDVDLATSALPQEVKALFPITIDVGIEHGTVLVRHQGNSYEITTFRSEGDYADHRRPDAVTFVRDLKEDLLRRDFTINALAVDRSGQVVDYYGGLDDLAKGCIRCVGVARERFEEDALRLLRAVRFQSQLDFHIEASTLAAMTEKAPTLSYVSVERLTNEWHKTLLTPHYSQAIQTFLQTGLSRSCPLMNDYVEALEWLVKHPILFLDEADAWTSLLYLAHQDGSTCHLLQKAYKLSNKLTTTIQHRIEALKALTDGKWSIIAIYQFGDSFDHVIPLAEQLPLVFDHPDADEVYSRLPIHSKKDMAIKGQDLVNTFQLKGPAIGYWLDRVELAIVKGQIPNERQQGLSWLREQLTAELVNGC